MKNRNGSGDRNRSQAEPVEPKHCRCAKNVHASMLRTCLHFILSGDEINPGVRCRANKCQSDAIAGLTDLNIDAEHALEALRLYALWVEVIAARRAAGESSSISSSDFRRSSIRLFQAARRRQTHRPVCYYSAKEMIRTCDRH
jgi:hypothetical protein